MDIKTRIDELSEAEAKGALFSVCIRDGVAAYTFAEKRTGTEEDYEMGILESALYEAGFYEYTDWFDKPIKEARE